MIKRMHLSAGKRTHVEVGIFDGSGCSDPRVVDEDVERPVPGDLFGDCGGHLRRVGHIARHVAARDVE